MAKSENILRVLIVEDTPNDVELLVRGLSRGGFTVSSEAVDQRSSLEQELRTNAWDLVLSDFNLTELNGFDVVQLVKKLAPSTPVIVVSGAVGEETAADLLRAGAKDFISKNNLARLVPAVERELSEASRIQQLRLLEGKLGELERNLKTVVNAVEDHAILMIDRERRILSWNKGAEKLIGYVDSEVLGKKADIFYTEEDLRAGLPQADFEQALNGNSAQMERWKVRKDGSRFWASGSVTAVLEPDGRVSAFAQILRDDTSKKRAREELEAAKLKAESANLAKSQFLANMSHEIRTPLGVMLGYAELIIDEIDPRAALVHGERILKNGRLLSRIIDDVLDVSKVEANCLEIEKVPTSVRETVADAISILQLKANEKGIALNLAVDEDVPAQILTDPTRLRQVLLNLIGNAVKFTASGEVRIHAKYARDESLKIQVSDTGKGISAAAQSKLFRPFSQGDVSVNRQFGGTGLGLYLSKRLCQGLGGDLQLVESTERKGSTFEITIAAEAVAKAPASSAPSKAEASATAQVAAGSKVLVIDDSVDNRAIFKYFLEHSGAQVDCAINGIEGLQKISDGSYDVVLLDIQMPILDGYAVIGKLREAGFRQPVIALTAHALDSEKQKCLSLGFSDHVAKPVTRQSLVAAVAHWAAQTKQEPDHRT